MGSAVKKIEVMVSFDWCELKKFEIDLLKFEIYNRYSWFVGMTIL